jgi:hypothetical protein
MWLITALAVTFSIAAARPHGVFTGVVDRGALGAFNENKR